MRNFGNDLSFITSFLLWTAKASTDLLFGPFGFSFWTGRASRERSSLPPREALEQLEFCFHFQEAAVQFHVRVCQHFYLFGETADSLLNQDDLADCG
jgi:hypothetical protein